MARIRTIKPEFPQSESMGRVSRDSRLLFVLLWTICDDSGRTRGASRMLASLLFPYDDDAPINIDRWIAELEREGCLVRYSADGNTYIEICNWLSHQKIDKPSASKIPPFAESSRIFSNPRERSSEDQGPRTKEGIKERTKDQGTISVEPALPISAPVDSSEPDGEEDTRPSNGKPDASPIVCEFPCAGKPSSWVLRQSKVDEWVESFPAVDVVAQIRKARQWCLDNSSRRKTARGMPAFLGRWMASQQDQAKPPSPKPANGSPAAAATPSNLIPGVARSAQRELSNEELEDKLRRIKERTYVVGEDD